eukprot:scaffold96896_cov60-Phaeocystis_antarctica.AAC.1
MLGVVLGVASAAPRRVARCPRPELHPPVARAAPPPPAAPNPVGGARARAAARWARRRQAGRAPAL